MEHVRNCDVGKQTKYKSPLTFLLQKLNDYTANPAQSVTPECVWLTVFLNDVIYMKVPKLAGRSRRCGISTLANGTASESDQ